MPTSDLKIAAAYIRVSTDDQEEYSPDSQVRLIREYARKNGYLLPEEYVFQDDGISAATARKRPAFNRMIALAKEKERPFDAILVLMFSRFARNREESVLYKGLLRKQGISVISVKEPAVDGPFGTLIESIIEWFDEYYLINLSAEVKRGMSEKFLRGEAMGTAPFGYRIDSANKTLRWIRNGRRSCAMCSAPTPMAPGSGTSPCSWAMPGSLRGAATGRTTDLWSICSATPYTSGRYVGRPDTKPGIPAYI